MSPKPFLILITVLAVVSISCGISIDLPVEQINTGPTVREEINIPLVDAGTPAELVIGFGAGELKIDPGTQDALVAGVAEYNVPDFKPDVTIDGNRVSLETGDLEIGGIPSFRNRFKNEWNLQLGSQPMELSINAGAYKGILELGGLSLLSLDISDGASEVGLSFSNPNLVAMELLRYNTGASSVKLTGLANANAQEMIFKGGAGEYVLDFSGQLQQDMDVSIDAGISSVNLIVPQGVSARLLFDGGLSNVDIHGDWEKSGSMYEMTGDGPRITINVNMGAGNLELRNR